MHILSCVCLAEDNKPKYDMLWWKISCVQWLLMALNLQLTHFTVELNSLCDFSVNSFQ